MGARVKIFAPATVSNLGPGFDVLGLALEAPGDIVEAEPATRPGVELVEVSGDSGVLSRDPARNAATVAAATALRLVEQKTGGAGLGLRMWLRKGMPLASGLGSSGASSAAGAVAVSAIWDGILDRLELVTCAMEGERATCGSAHADNVAPSILGGIVLVRSYDPLEVLSLPVPAMLRLAVVRPHVAIATGEARALVKNRRFAIDDIVSNLGQLGALVTALHRGDLKLLGRATTDRLVEPLRAALVPGFESVRQAALAAGALGCSISGSGPSLFAFCEDQATAERVGAAMQAAFRAVAGLVSDVYVGPVNPVGARRIE